MMAMWSQGQYYKQIGVGLLASLVSVLAACGRDPSPQTAEQPKTPARIVSLSPSVTEILYGVGAWPQVVAVSQYCDYPPEVTEKPRVDGWRNTNLEQVMALRPDLVIGAEGQAPFVRDKLNALGVRTLFLPSQSLDEVLAAIREIGRAVGHEREGDALTARTQGELDAVRAAVANRQRPRVLCVVGRVPGTLRDLHAATRGSFLDDLVGVAGGESIAPPTERGYGKMTKEAVVALNPEVIIDMVQGSKGNFGEDPIAVWRELPEIRAVQTGRIFPLRDTKVIHPSQFVGLTARTFARAIHPEVFGH
jgi:iron complex transport system substrate-binding protein